MTTLQLPHQPCNPHSSNYISYVKPKKLKGIYLTTCYNMYHCTNMNLISTTFVQCCCVLYQPAHANTETYRPSFCKNKCTHHSFRSLQQPQICVSMKTSDNTIIRSCFSLWLSGFQLKINCKRSNNE